MFVFAKIHNIVFSLSGDVRAGFVDWGEVGVDLDLSGHTWDFKRELIIIGQSVIKEIIGFSD